MQKSERPMLQRGMVQVVMATDCPTFASWLFISGIPLRPLRLCVMLFGKRRRHHAESQSARRGRQMRGMLLSRKGDDGGVEKPGGLFNTCCLTGPGGLLNYQGGFSTNVCPEVRLKP